MSDLVDELFARVREAGSPSTRVWTARAGVSLSTLHRVSVPAARVNALTLARLGLTVGLRMELSPLRPQSEQERRRERSSAPSLPGHVGVRPGADAAYLLALAGAELRHLRVAGPYPRTAAAMAREVGVSDRTVQRTETAAAPWPAVHHLERLARAVGHAVVWRPTASAWRARPWQSVVRGSAPTRAQLIARARATGPRGALYLHLDQTWRTPKDLFARLLEEFDIRLDVAAQAHNALCAFWLGPDHPDADRRDALRWSDWAAIARQAGNEEGGPAWAYANPEYGAGAGEWTSRAAETAARGVGVVALLPARTDTEYWHRDVLGRGAETRFVRGRLKFNDGPVSAPFASVLVIWHPTQDRGDSATP